jgi:hypothetical protein
MAVYRWRPDCLAHLGVGMLRMLRMVCYSTGSGMMQV